jgi:hypothetical protein
LLNIYDCIVNDGLARIVKDGLARVMRKPHMMQPHRGVMEAGKEVRRWATSPVTCLTRPHATDELSRRPHWRTACIPFGIMLTNKEGKRKVWAKEEEVTVT